MDNTPDSNPFPAPLAPPSSRSAEPTSSGSTTPEPDDTRQRKSNRVRNLVVAGAAAFGAVTGGVIWITAKSGPAGDDVDLLTEPVVVLDDRAAIDMSYPAEWDELDGGAGDDILGEAPDDVLAEERRDTIDPFPGDDIIDAPGNDGEGDDLIIDDPDHPEDLDPVLIEEPAGRVCLNTVHLPADGQQSLSRVEPSGEILGAPDGSIVVVEGPTFNQGQPIEIPIIDDAFAGQLGINQQGHHPFDRFEVVFPDGTPPVDLIEATSGGGFTLDDPGPLVGPGEGPLFDNECVDLHSYRYAESLSDAELRTEVSQLLSQFVDNH
ncbi:MAG: hypothetical protein AAFY28_03015, partial [Actinomycetota bacterium]